MANEPVVGGLKVQMTLDKAELDAALEQVNAEVRAFANSLESDLNPSLSSASREFAATKEQASGLVQQLAAMRGAVARIAIPVAAAKGLVFLIDTVRELGELADQLNAKYDAINKNLARAAAAEQNLTEAQQARAKIRQDAIAAEEEATAAFVQEMEKRGNALQDFLRSAVTSTTSRMLEEDLNAALSGIATTTAERLKRVDEDIAAERRAAAEKRLKEAKEAAQKEIEETAALRMAALIESLQDEERVRMEFNVRIGTAMRQQRAALTDEARQNIAEAIRFMEEAEKQAIQEIEERRRQEQERTHREEMERIRRENAERIKGLNDFAALQRQQTAGNDDLIYSVGRIQRAAEAIAAKPQPRPGKKT